MATSQFYSVCLAQESIRACRAILLASPCPSRCVLQAHAKAAMVHKLRLPRLSFGGSSGCGLLGPNGLSCRAFSAVGSSPKSRKAAETYNPREEIRKLDEEIHKLERERRSVGKGKNAGPSGSGGKALYGGRKANAVNNSEKVAANAKPAPSNRSIKLTASSGNSRNANARAMARFAQVEEEEDDDEEEDNEDDIADEDDEELGDDFSSDAEMYMESTDVEEEDDTESPGASSLASEKPKPSPVTTETHTVDSAAAAVTRSEAPIEGAVSCEEGLTEGVPAEEVPSTKHPWKEWNDFFDALSQKNYFKDVPSSKSSLAGEGYLQFQSSSHMKRAVLEFSRERDDIIRFLTKKHIRTVVNVGCPSTDRKVVNACKRLRVLCEIPEDEVCQQCKLKTFCTRAFAAPSPDLVAETADVARVLYSFALNASPNAESQVSYPVTVVKSVCHLIDEIVQLSAYPKDPGLPPLKSRIPVKQSVVEKDQVDTNHRHGDWTCPDCTFLNFSKNTECRECGTLRESAKKLEPGDWECPECTFVNFRRNRECRECLTPRPPGVGEPDGRVENMMPGDWKCPECQFVNFRRNLTCRKCSIKRPKDMEPHDDEDYEPGDWKCPECNFRNFQRNKNCRECGKLSPEQARKDDRWGLKKTSAESGGWGSKKSPQTSDAESDKPSGRPKYQEWKPDLNKAIADDSDDDLEENADVVFDRGDNDNGSPRPSKAFSKGTQSKGSTLRRDEGSLSDFDFSDLDDHPKKSQKNRESKNIGKDEDEDDEEDDDNDMLDELSEEEELTSTAAPKKTPAKSRGPLRKWDVSASDDDDLSEDEPFASKAASRRTPAKGKALSRKWDDSDDDEDEGFSDDHDFGRNRGRGRSSRGGQRGRDFGGNGGQRGGSFGSYGGSQRGGSFSSSRGAERGESYGLGGRGRRTSSFLDSSDDGEFGRKGGGRGGRGGFTRGGGRHSSRFSESSGEDDEFSRGNGGRGGRGGFSRGGGGRNSRFSESSGEDDELSRGSGRRAGRGEFARGGGGRGRDGGFSRGGRSGFERRENFSRGGGRGGFERSESFSRGGGRGGFERSGSFSRGGGRGGFEDGRGRGGGGGRGRGGRRGRS